MPKIKTHKSTKKRVRVTRTGKIMRGGSQKGHLMQKKSESRKRRNRKDKVVDPSRVKRVKRSLGM